MATVDFTPWQVDHLIQLVGGNPMPNAIAGPFLVRPGGTITLIHSKGTQETAERLRTVLSQRTKAEVRLSKTPVQEADPAHISQVVSEELRQRPGKVGLDYTAGTKAMVVHAYRTVAACPDAATFAYLDPRPDALVIHPSDPTKFQDKLSVREVHVPFEQMMSLQGARLHYATPTPQTVPHLVEAAKKIAQFNQDCWDYRNEWTRWNKKLDKRAGQKTYDSSRSFSMDDCLVNFDDTLPEAIYSAETLGEAAQACGLSVDTLGKWFQGGWLENLTLAAFIAATPDGTALEDIQSGVEINMGQIRGARRFEVDVMAVHHHRLIATSCTVDGKQAKTKFFEAIQRARQVGGDESRVCLVACLESSWVQSTKQEVERILSQNRYIEVLGLDDLLNLPERITAWLEEKKA